jgi:vitamin B12 transporter
MPSVRPLVLIPVLAALAAADPPEAAQPARLQATASATTTVITVTATDRREIALDRTTASAEVVDASDDRRAGHPLAWWRLLDGLPGIDARPTYGGLNGDDTALSIRGAPDRDVQVVLDGIPLDDPTSVSGGPNPGLVPAAGIERITVVKGSQSGLYGSRAVGGVIAIDSLRPGTTWRSDARVEAGSFRTVRADVTAAGPIDGTFGLAAGVSVMHSKGYSNQTDADAHGAPRDHEADGVDRGSASLRLTAKLDHGVELYLGVLGSAVNQEFDAFDPFTFSPLPDDAASMTRSRLARGSIGGTWRVGGVRIGVDAARTYSRRTYAQADTTASPYDGVDDFGSVHADGAWAPSPDLTFHLAGGADGRRSKARIQDNTYGSSFTKSAGLGGAWGSLGAGNDHFELSGTGREDWHSREGDVRTWRLGAAWWPVALVRSALRQADGVDVRLVKLRVAAGTAFRAPSLYELYDPTYGTPDLQAQRSRSFEWGGDLHLTGWAEAGATVFRTRYETLMGYDPATFKTINVDGPQIHGVEANIKLAPQTIGLRAQVSFTRLRDDQSGAALARQANRRWVVDLGWEEGPLWIGGRAERATSRYYPGFLASGLPGYTLYSANARWQVDAVWAVYARGENLGNEAYEASPGYATQPRSVFAGVEAAF